MKRPPRHRATSNGDARPRAARVARKDTVLITGGAGFIGTNLAARLAASGKQVLVYDNLSRPGVERNLAWLRQAFGQRVEPIVADVGDEAPLSRAVQRAGQVFHFAAQVAVTTSLEDPRHDFQTNMRGTFHLLEAIRAAAAPPALVFTSTNKVYGNLEDIPLRADGGRYAPLAARLERFGVGERRPLDFHSPYGCSKGAADQYVLDYARCYAIPAVVFRMSCIYGRHQWGTEDQGWVAHFALRALRGEPITIYGDGRQVRDVLFADDLVEALLLASEQAARLRGQVFNVGGGPARTISLLELVELIHELAGRRPQVEFAPWRTGDQRYYVSDTRKFRRLTGWRARTSVRAGVAALLGWLRDHAPVKPHAARPALAAPIARTG